MPARHTAVIPADYTSAAIAPTIPASVNYYPFYRNDYLVAISILSILGILVSQISFSESSNQNTSDVYF
jgi:hypothetical protein